MIAAGQQPQALRRFVEQLGLRQNSAADRDRGVGGKNEGAAQLVVELYRFKRGRGLRMRQPVRIGAGQFAAARRLVDIDGLERIRLDAGLIDQRQPARRAGGKDEFRATDHVRAEANGVAAGFSTLIR